MSALPILCVLAQAGGSGQSINGFWYGAGRIVAILLAVLLAFVVVALVRAGRGGR